MKNSRKINIIRIVNEIVKENDIIVSEKLQTKEMSQNHRLAKLVNDACFNKICSLLQWKTKVTNDLNIRNWKCEKCGREHDRDINASINIMFEGLKIHYGVN